MGGFKIQFIDQPDSIYLKHYLEYQQIYDLKIYIELNKQIPQILEINLIKNIIKVNRNNINNTPVIPIKMWKK